MKIEIGESLFYSWLRHVKDCQIVQTNWKVSPQWELRCEDELQQLMQDADAYFAEKYGYAVFKKNTLSQMIRQAECDVLGMALQFDGSIEYHAVDVAFHEGGLQYGGKQETVERIIKKCLRTAMCLRGCLNAEKAVIIFASPKINPAQIAALTPCMDDVNNILQSHGYAYQVRLIANEDFETQVLKPILLLSEDVADTAELFMRSYQMYRLFTTTERMPHSHAASVQTVSDDAYAELKVGKIANTILRTRLEAGYATAEEIHHMQDKAYSRQVFGINFPLLVKAGSDYDKARYYSTSLKINGEIYYLCSQWVESAVNNDRPYLIAWLDAHGALPPP